MTGAFALILLACQPKGDTGTSPDLQETAGDSDTPADSADSADSADTAPSLVLSGSASVRDNPDNPFSAFVTVTVDHAAEVTVAYGEAELDHAAPVVRVRAGVPTDVLLLGLHAARVFRIAPSATAEGASWSADELAYTTAPLPEDWPVATPTFYLPESDYSADEALCTNGSTASEQHMYMCVDRWGAPVFSLRTVDDDRLLSITAMPDGSWVSTSLSTSKLLFADAAGAETRELTAPYFKGRTRFEHEHVNSHEAYPIPEGAWAGYVAFITDSTEYLRSGNYKVGSGLIVYDPATDAVVYDYSFLGDLSDGEANDPLVPFSRAGHGDYDQDWTHANALLHGMDPDGREFFLVSLKAQDWIVKLYPDTDELAWRLGWEGDFTLVDDLDAAAPVELGSVEWFFHQHGMRLLSVDGARMRLLMLDNGYPRETEAGPVQTDKYSRTVEVTLDTGTHLAAVTWQAGTSDSTAADYFLSTTCGNAELLPAGESVLTVDGEHHQLREVGYPDSALRWTLDVESTEWCLYRAHWFPSLYETMWFYP